MILRDYQERAINEIEALWKAGKNRVLWWAPTGAGKGIVLSHLLERAARDGKKALFVVRGKELVGQGSRRLGCRHSVFMASDKRFDRSEPIQVCSIDTLTRRREYPEAELVVIDEVHFSTSESYLTFARHYPAANILGVSATPYNTNPLTHLCEHLVVTCDIQSLIRDGYLVPPRYFAPDRPDLRGVKRTGGDYNEKSLEEIMLKRKVVGQVVETWKEKGENRSTLCFAVTVAHSKALCDEFLWAGITVAHMDANTPDEERRSILEAHEKGEIKIIVNVGILTVGVDLPWLGCISVARPTLSLILNDQMLGRGTRPYPGKKDFLVLDHAGNVFYHGFITDERTPTLIGRENRKLPGDAAVRTCRECYAVLPISCKVCPECGTDLEEIKNPRIILTAEGRLVEVEAWKLLPKIDQARRLKNQLVHLGMKRGWKRGFVYYKLKQQFGADIASSVFPQSSSQSLSFRDLG